MISCSEDIESRIQLSTANRLSRIQILKVTMIGKEFSGAILLSEFTNGQQLQSKFRTKRTDSRVRSLERTTKLVRTLLIENHQLYE